jgi:hypothetical protein
MNLLQELQRRGKRDGRPMHGGASPVFGRAAPRSAIQGDGRSKSRDGRQISHCTPGLNPCNSGRAHLGRAKEHALAESVSVAEYFDIEAHPLTKAHDVDVRVRDDGLNAVTHT